MYNWKQMLRFLLVRYLLSLFSDRVLFLGCKLLRRLRRVYLRVAATNHIATKEFGYLSDAEAYRDNAIRYNEESRRLRELFSETHVTIVDIEQAIRATDTVSNGCLLPDGVHLNIHGHNMYTKIVSPEIIKVLGCT